MTVPKLESAGASVEEDSICDEQGVFEWTSAIAVTERSKSRHKDGPDLADGRSLLRELADLASSEVRRLLHYSVKRNLLLTGGFKDDVANLVRRSINVALTSFEEKMEDYVAFAVQRLEAAAEPVDGAARSPRADPLTACVPLLLDRDVLQRQLQRAVEHGKEMTSKIEEAEQRYDSLQCLFRKLRGQYYTEVMQLRQRVSKLKLLGGSRNPEVEVLEEDISFFNNKDFLDNEMQVLLKAKEAEMKGRHQVRDRVMNRQMERINTDLEFERKRRIDLEEENMAMMSKLRQVSKRSSAAIQEVSDEEAEGAEPASEQSRKGTRRANRLRDADQDEKLALFTLQVRSSVSDVVIQLDSLQHLQDHFKQRIESEYAFIAQEDGDLASDMLLKIAEKTKDLRLAWTETEKVAQTTMAEVADYGPAKRLRELEQVLKSHKELLYVRENEVAVLTVDKEQLNSMLKSEHYQPFHLLNVQKEMSADIKRRDATIAAMQKDIDLVNQKYEVLEKIHEGVAMELDTIKDQCRTLRTQVSESESFLKKFKNNRRASVAAGRGRAVAAAEDFPRSNDVGCQTHMNDQHPGPSTARRGSVSMSMKTSPTKSRRASIVVAPHLPPPEDSQAHPGHASPEVQAEANSQDRQAETQAVVHRADIKAERALDEAPHGHAPIAKSEVMQEQSALREPAAIELTAHENMNLNGQRPQVVIQTSPSVDLLKVQEDPGQDVGDASESEGSEFPGTMGISQVELQEIVTTAVQHERIRWQALLPRHHSVEAPPGCGGMRRHLRDDRLVYGERRPRQASPRRLESVLLHAEEEADYLRRSALFETLAGGRLAKDNPLVAAGVEEIDKSHLKLLKLASGIKRWHRETLEGQLSVSLRADACRLEAIELRRSCEAAEVRESVAWELQRQCMRQCHRALKRSGDTEMGLKIDKALLAGSATEALKLVDFDVERGCSAAVINRLRDARDKARLAARRRFDELQGRALAEAALLVQPQELLGQQVLQDRMRKAGIPLDEELPNSEEAWLPRIARLQQFRIDEIVSTLEAKAQSRSFPENFEAVDDILSRLETSDCKEAELTDADTAIGSVGAADSASESDAEVQDVRDEGTVAPLSTTEESGLADDQNHLSLALPSIALLAWVPPPFGISLGQTQDGADDAEDAVHLAELLEQVSFGERAAARALFAECSNNPTMQEMLRFAANWLVRNGGHDVREDIFRTSVPEEEMTPEQIRLMTVLCPRCVEHAPLEALRLAMRPVMEDQMVQVFMDPRKHLKKEQHVQTDPLAVDRDETSRRMSLRDGGRKASLLTAVAANMRQGSRRPSFCADGLDFASISALSPLASQSSRTRRASTGRGAIISQAANAALLRLSVTMSGKDEDFHEFRKAQQARSLMQLPEYRPHTSADEDRDEDEEQDHLEVELEHEQEHGREQDQEQELRETKDEQEENNNDEEQVFPREHVQKCQQQHAQQQLQQQPDWQEHEEKLEPHHHRHRQHHHQHREDEEQSEHNEQGPVECPHQELVQRGDTHDSENSRERYDQLGELPNCESPAGEPVRVQRRRKRPNAAERTSSMMSLTSQFEEDVDPEGTDSPGQTQSNLMHLMDDMLYEVVDAGQQADLNWEQLPNRMLEWLRLNLMQRQQAVMYNVSWTASELEDFPRLPLPSREQLLKDFEYFLFNVMGMSRPARATEQRSTLRHHYRDNLLRATSAGDGAEAPRLKPSNASRAIGTAPAKFGVSAQRLIQLSADGIPDFRILGVLPPATPKPTKASQAKQDPLLQVRLPREDNVVVRVPSTDSLELGENVMDDALVSGSLRKPVERPSLAETSEESQQSIPYLTDVITSYLGFDSSKALLSQVQQDIYCRRVFAGDLAQAAVSQNCFTTTRSNCSPPQVETQTQMRALIDMPAAVDRDTDQRLHRVELDLTMLPTIVQPQFGIPARAHTARSASRPTSTIQVTERKQMHAGPGVSVSALSSLPSVDQTKSRTQRARLLAQRLEKLRAFHKGAIPQQVHDQLTSMDLVDKQAYSQAAVLASYEDHHQRLLELLEPVKRRIVKLPGQEVPDKSVSLHDLSWEIGGGNDATKALHVQQALEALVDSAVRRRSVTNELKRYAFDMLMSHSVSCEDSVAERAQPMDAMSPTDGGIASYAFATEVPVSPARACTAGTGVPAARVSAYVSHRPATSCASRIMVADLAAEMKNNGAACPPGINKFIGAVAWSYKNPVAAMPPGPAGPQDQSARQDSLGTGVLSLQLNNEPETETGTCSHHGMSPDGSVRRPYRRKVAPHLPPEVRSPRFSLASVALTPESPVSFGFSSLLSEHLTAATPAMGSVFAQALSRGGSPRKPGLKG